MKKYIPKPGVPNPTPKPGDSKSEGESRRITKPMEPLLPPLRRDGPGAFTEKRREGRRPDVKGRRVSPPKKEKRPLPKPRGVSDEQLVPRRVKPTPNRRRFLEQLNEMNKKSR